MKSKNDGPNVTSHSILQRAIQSTPDIPIKQICIGEDAALQLVDYAQSLGDGMWLVVSDMNTRDAADATLFGALRSVRNRVVEKVFPSGALDATDARAQEVADTYPDASVIIGVGAGTICDLAKYAAHTIQKPAILFGTAASMNGYTSGIAALKVRGLKRTLPCTPANAVFVDPAVAAAAPQPMAAAGLADFLSKCSACADWRAAHWLRGEYFREDALKFYDGLVDRILEAAPAVGHADSEAISLLTEALMLSGLSMLMAGSSSPASGGEHLISHYIDMKSAFDGTPHDLHGAQVGVATLHCLRLWSSVLELDPAKIDPALCAENHATPEHIVASIRRDWGVTAEEVLEQWVQKERSKCDIEREVRQVAENGSMLAKLVAPDLLPASRIEVAIQQAGGPTLSAQLDVPEVMYRQAVKSARYIRNRFTILDLAAELQIA